MRTQEELAGVTLLGETHTRYPDTYSPQVLETFVNKHPENEYLVTFDCPEFTSLCPITGQPDFAEIKIMYIPGERMVEGDFHEDCINIIMKDLVRLMDPRYLEVTGRFTPRGGIRILPFANYADAEHELLKQQRLAAQLAAVIAQ